MHDAARKTRASGEHLRKLTGCQKRHVHCAPKAFADWTQCPTYVTYLGIPDDKDIDIAVGPPRTYNPRPVDECHENVVPTLKDGAQALLYANCEIQKRHKRLVERILSCRPESVGPRGRITTNEPGRLRPLKLTVDRRLWRAKRIGQLPQRPASLGLQQYKPQEAHLHLGAE